MEIFRASHQWASRPADERFDSLEAMHTATRQYAYDSKTKTVPWADLRVEAAGDDLNLVGRANLPAKVTHYAFGQLAGRAGAPAAYLRDLPATLAAQNINHGLKSKADATDAQLLFHRNGGLILRAATSDRYARIWNYEVIERLMALSQRHGLIPGQQTFSWTDGGPGSTPTALPVVASGQKSLYASDHDMFAFLMTPDRTVLSPTGQTMRRGIITANSEVGDRSLSIMGFLFVDVCGNHIIWGAQQIAEIRLTHIGSVRERWLDATVQVRRYLDGAASLDQAKMQQLTVRIGDDKDAVLDKLFGIRSIGLSRKALSASYDAVVPAEDGDPRSVWGMVSGVTRYSQQLPYADERTSLDRAAGRILEEAF